MTKLEDLIRIGHDRAAHALYAEITPAMLDASVEAPARLLGLARLQAAGWVSDRTVADFVVHERSFERVWQMARTLRDQGRLSRVIRVTLASGWPEMPGTLLEAPTHEEAMAALSLGGDPAACRGWRPEWLKLQLQAESARLGIAGTLRDADIGSALIRFSQHGERIRKVSIRAEVGRPRPRPWTILVDAERLQVELVINDAAALVKREEWPAMLLGIRRALEELAERPQESRYFRLLGRHVGRQLRAAAAGPEALGMGLPRSILGGFVLRRHLEHDGLPETSDLEQLEPVVAFCRGTPEKCHFEHGLVRLAAGGETTTATGLAGAPFKRLDPRRPSYHLQALEAAAQSLRMSHRWRDVQAMSLCINESEAPAIRQRITELRAVLAPLARQHPPGPMIVQLNTQFFPFTRLKPAWRGAEGSTASPLPPTLSGRWLVSILRELVGLAEFRPDPHWIAAILYPTIEPTQAKAVFDALVRSGQVIEDRARNRYVLANSNVQAEDVGGDMVLSFHRDMIEMAAAAVAFAPPERTEIFAGTFSCAIPTFEIIRAEVIAALGDIFTMAAAAHAPDQVYQLNTQVISVDLVDASTAAPPAW